MHQPDLYLPVPPVTSHFAPPVRSPASASAWPQSTSSSTAPKKRNVERACDGCRRRKTRCDGPKMPDNVCTNCVQNRKICTYVEASKPRGPSKAYITSLEDRVEKMEALLKRLRPETDFSAELGPPILRGSWKNEPDFPTSTPAPGKKSSPLSLHQFHPLSTLPPVALSRKASLTSMSAMSDHEGNLSPDDAADDPLDTIIQKTRRLTLLDKRPQDKANRTLDAAVRFHGKSTNFYLIMATREMRMMYLLESTGATPDTVNNEVGRTATHGPDQHAQAFEGGLRRQEYWRSLDWELAYEGEFLSSENLSELLQNWPPSDLVTALIDLYFLHCNSMFPILHRPTFERHFADGLYERDIWFACLCMSVFALASRYTDDLRVLLDEPVESPVGEHSEQSRWQAAGFRYYFSILEVGNKKRATLNPASLFEIQTLCLTTQFQSETRWHRGTWYAIGDGIRKMQDIGAHSKQSYVKGPTVENELWKRVWWYLIGLDRMQCAILGRPCAAKEEDFTTEYPLEVDDDFWENEDPQLAFRQPPDKPSTVTAFNLWLKLTNFTASALHCFDIVEHDGPSSALRAQDVMNQLNENLTEWAETVPQHLKWSPDIEDVTLANQSATLYTAYNLVTILIQRAFLPSSVALLCSSNIAQSIQPVVAQAMTARAISINAAKAVARILAVMHKRALSNVPLLLTGAEITIAVLCIDWWILKARDGKFAPSPTQTRESHVQDVKLLLTALRWAAPRWETAQERLAYLEKIVPDLDNESANLDHVSTFNLIRERQEGRLSPLKPQHPMATPLRPDFSHSGSHVSAGFTSETVGTSTRHARGRGEEPWLAGLSRQYNPPQHSSAHSTPRISSYSLLPRIRASNSIDHSRRSLDEWGIPVKSYSTPSLLPTSGHSHVVPALDPDHSSQFPYVKPEPDTDLTTPPSRLGWTYMGHQAPLVPPWEVPGSRHSASAARDSPGTSLLSHLQQPGRDPASPSDSEHVFTV